MAFKESKAMLKASERIRFQRNPLTSPKERSPEPGWLGNVYILNQRENNLVLLSKVLTSNILWSSYHLQYSSPHGRNLNNLGQKSNGPWNQPGQGRKLLKAESKDGVFSKLPACNNHSGFILSIFKVQPAHHFHC